MASVSSVSFSKDLFGKVDEAGEGEDGDSDKDEEETKLFVKNTLCEMGDGKGMSEAEFERCFEEFDEDGSGTIERDEMITFIKNITGL